MLQLQEKDFISESGRRAYQRVMGAVRGSKVVELEESKEEIVRSVPSRGKVLSLESKIGRSYRKTFPVPEKVSKYISFLGEVVKYARALVEGHEQDNRFKPVIDEDANMLRQVLCLVGNVHYMLKGSSGSGKTHLVDKILTLVPEEEVYRAGLSSEVAHFRNAKNVNGASIIYIPEIQKLVNSRKNSPVREMVKDLAENKSSQRSRVTPQGEVATDLIRSGKMIITTAALEGQYLGEEDRELKRRLIYLNTNESREHLQKVNDYKANSRLRGREEFSFSELDYNRLKEQIQDYRNRDFEVVDPFSLCLRELIPDVPKSVGYSEHYFKLLDACAKFHYPQRTVVGKRLYLALEDHFVVHSLFYDSFFKTMGELSGPEEAVAEELFNPISVDWSQWWEKGAEIMQNDPQVYSSWKEAQMSKEGIYLNDHLGNQVLLSKESTAELKKEGA